MLSQLNLVIVEDEPWTLSALAAMVKRTGAPYSVKGTASDGEEALTVINEVSPNVVFTDIRMPRMDGLELAAYIYRNYPWIKTVIISGYSDFSYARQGIKYNVVDYLLKPVTQVKLNDALNRVAHIMEKENCYSYERSWNPEVVNCFHDLTKKTELLDEKGAEESLYRLWQLLIGPKTSGNHELLQVCRMIMNALCRHLKLDELINKVTFRPGDENHLYRQLRFNLQNILARIKSMENRNTRQALLKVKDYIDKNYHKFITLKELSEVAFLNQNYLSELFKEEFGESFLSYLTRIRLEEAVRLLKETNLTVYQIAERVGYQDQAYFSRIFKKKTGYNPVEYRKRLGAI